MKAKKPKEGLSTAELQKQLDEATIQLQKLQHEVEVEAALERVRSRTMAMHHSDEFRETVGILFEQLKGLDFNLQQCALTLIDEKRREAESWQAADVQSILPMSFRMSFIDHPIFDKMVQDGVFDKEGYTVTEYSGEQKKEFDDFVFNHTPLKHAPAHVLEFMFSHDKIVLCRAHMAYGFVEVVSNNEPLPQEKAGVLQRLAKVFEQTYTRFLDLKKAEIQAREAQIEAALERVRASTMAMHYSDELANAATVLFHQLFDLGIKPMACAFVILNPEDQTGEVWITSDGTVNSASFTHPYHTDLVQERIYQAWRAGRSYLIEDLQGDILKEHLQFISENMPVEDLMEAAGNAAPKRLVIHAVYFSHGFLGFNYEQPIEEHLDLLGRFTKVFDQTYTRFLDLQKAEAQAREAHIEAALERVRASSMAMHKSTELPDVALVLVNQLAQLDIRQLGSSILIIDDKLETYRQYSAHDSLVDSNKILNIVEDLDLNALYLGKEILRLSRAGKKDFTIPLSGDHLQQWMLYTREKVHRERGDAMLRAGFECIYFHFAVFQDISQIVITTLMPLPERDRKVLRRMADTFGMSFRRYLDLQQAESQAREAEIQLALERVRARTMAMHNSEELSDVIAIVSEQLQQLKIRFDHVSFAINSDAEDYHFWTALYGKPRPYELKVPYLDNPIANRAKEVRSKGLKFYQDTLTPEENREWLEHAFKHNPSDYLSAEEKAYVLSRGFSRSFVIMPNIIFNVGNYASRPYSEEDNEIINRFATVFEQTYTRFLDLKKAEAQAREAQIEAALERIRAAAMAMHSSQGLSDVTAVLREQLALLGQKALESCILALYDKGSETYAAYYTYKKPNGDSQEFVQDKVTVPWKETAWSRTVIKHYLAGETHFSIHANHKMLKEWYKMLARLAPETIEKNIQGKLIVPAELYYDFAAFSGGLLWMVAYNEPSQETSELLDRAAATFDIAYRRYLDLIKAEKQAREAHIEAALERVRGRTMAMHQSNELAETASLLFTQLNSLGIQPWSCGFNIWSRDMQFHDAWMSHPEGGILPPMQMPNHSIPVHKNILEAYTRKETLFIQELSGDDLLQHFKLLAKVPQVGEILAGLVESGFQIPTHLVFYAIFFSEGFLFFQTEKRSAESIDLFVRFTKVFDQTYTRFLDLKKAEEQAREAQIEAALERVRSSSMAMHKSDELKDVVLKIFEGMSGLGFSPTVCNIALVDRQTWDTDVWTAHVISQGILTYNLHIPHFEHPFREQLIESFRNEVPFSIHELSGALKSSYEYQFLQQIDFSAVPEAVRQSNEKTLNEENTVVLSAAYMKHGLLIVSRSSPIDAAESQILKRFAKVFEQSYTRFLDLLKAEAQAREAQIEAALERIRSRAIAMHQSDELLGTAKLMFHQLMDLGIELEVCGFIIIDESSRQGNQFMSIGGSLFPEPIPILFDQDPQLKASFKDWKDGKSTSILDIQGEDLIRHMDSMQDLYKELKSFDLLFPVAEVRKKPAGRLVVHHAFFHHGYLFLTSPKPIQELEILARFAKVFEQTYTRFLDLKKAEAQAREAQIEAALERVRAVSLAMHESKDLHKVVVSVFEQLGNLDVKGNSVLIHEIRDSTKDHYFWVASDNDQEYPELVHLPYADNQLFNRFENAIRSSESFFNDIFSKQSKDEVWQHHFVHHPVSKERQELLFSTPGVARSTALFEKTALSLFRYAPLPFSEEDNNILKRFGQVFEQSYTRFLDLKKAEAQTREAHIEAALERVRASTMAMQKSEELPETSFILFQQMKELGEPAEQLTIGVVHEENNVIDISATLHGDMLKKIYLHSIDEPFMMNKIYNAWKNQQKSLVVELKGDELNAYNKYRNELTKSEMFPTNLGNDHRRIVYAAFFSKGMLALAANDPRPKSLELLERFASVFDLTYTRFLDLQKAEAQAREAKIEAALERVRSRSLVMHKTDELQVVVRVLAEELKNTGVILDTWGAVICTYFQDSKDVLHWTAAEDPANPSVAFLLPYFQDALYDEAWASKNRGDSYFAKVFSFEVKNDFFNYAFEHSDYRHLPDDYKQMILESDSHGIAWAWAKNSAIMIPSIQGILPSEEEKEILIRFAKVFEQAYVRFMDLQKAEKQAQEAMKQAALDRVRGEIASMRSIEDLNRITPVIWRELISLDVPFIRCGVFIVDENAEVVKVYLTTPGGEALGVLHLPFDVNNQTTNTVNYWREKMVYREHWDAQTFTEWTQSMIEIGQVTNFTDYQGGSKIPDELHLHFVPFKQGMLYVGNVNPLSDEKIELVKTLAEAFAIAYARYEDFTRLELAKSQVETALAELKSAQAQLIQSEKMASLGELTAGIAHEIQNPLNFVNNFSDVNRELIDELISELAVGSWQSAEEIARDIKANEEKIQHHGKRADSIVKGMLQHSRTSTGEKELTDINALCDEYLRLAYHGLRARDKSFNAEFRTDLDPDLPKVEVIPQDIGRVLLNLINNAFQAVTGAEKPEVIISTKKLENGIEIRVTDNGSGIPDEIKDKIFQPFFTTKPTGSGTGLGLSLSYDIVKAHGGEIKVQSPPASEAGKDGTGCKFIVQLPNV